LFIAGGLALAVSLAMSVTLGAADLGLGEVLQSLSWRLGLSESGLTRLEEAVIWQMRAPRALLAAAVGAGLAVCGAVLQGLTRNALADPYLLGVSSGASTGAVAVLVLGVGGGVFALSLGALVGAVGAFAVVLALIGRRDASPARVILAGVAVSQFFAAVTSLVLMSSADNDNAKSLLGWLLGSLASANWVSLTAATAAVAIGGTVCWARASALDAFVFGRETAASLGVSPDRAAFRLFALTAMVTAVLVAASGAIGFVGLVVPHASRLLGARRHRLLLPASALIGALFLVWADVVSRVAFVPQQIPVGVVTALIGVPAFAAILRARMGRS
jgi:iron complex transport system permease protein